MRLTRRGLGVLAVVAVAEAMAFAFGARALNAVVAPGVVALAAAVIQVSRSDPPVAERGAVEHGFPGETRTVRVSVEGDGVVQIEETVPDGLIAEGTADELSPPGTVTYDLTLTERGAYTLGPLRASVRDVLGLVEKSYEGTTAEILVYPPVYRLVDRYAVFDETVDRAELERQEFDSLREYAPGDPLRDVHWKSTAKSPDTLYVTEYADRHVDREVVVAATADAGFSDEMATAVASVAVATIEAGLGVALRTPHATVPLGYGASQREEVLATLATAGAGTLADSVTAEADVHVHADVSGVEVRVGSRTYVFEDAIERRENPITGDPAGHPDGASGRRGDAAAGGRSTGDRGEVWAR